MELGIREDHRLLGRTRDTAEQHTLTAAQRKTHAEDIYYSLAKHADIKGKNVLLFDVKTASRYYYTEGGLFYSLCFSSSKVVAIAAQNTFFAPIFFSSPLHTLSVAPVV